MKHIKEKDTIKRDNSSVCKIIEYPLNDEDIDLVIAEITGRYPDKGYALNNASKELIYILDGRGKIIFKDKEIKYDKGDVVLINNNEAYYYDTNYTKVTISCNPAWNIKDYKNID